MNTGIGATGRIELKASVLALEDVPHERVFCDVLRKFYIWIRGRLYGDGVAFSFDLHSASAQGR